MICSWSTALIGFLSLRAVQAVPYSDYVLTPTSRTIRPISVYGVNGTVQNAQALTKSNGIALFSGASAVTYDFGKNIGGLVSFNVTDATGSANYIGITFTESSLWISNYSDATADAGLDEPLWFVVSSGVHYTAEKKYQRGGFRYLSVLYNGTGQVGVEDLSIYYTALPQVADTNLATYKGYFHCEDELLNRVWYAGAYTNELCTIDPTSGNSLVHLGDLSIQTPVTWWNNYTITNGTSALVDGAKRDRLVWPGDMAVAFPSMVVSTYDTQTVRNGLDSLLAQQNKTTGALPYAGVPFGLIVPVFSFTYHLYSLIAISDFYLFTGDIEYLNSTWQTFKFALEYSLSFIDSSGMANVTSSADWLRFGMGGHNIEANAILYHTINLGIGLAEVLNDSSVGEWSSLASKIKTAANAQLWDPSLNLYRDNDSLPLTSVHPQDGNSWAILSNLTTSAERTINISKALSSRWGKYGAPAPEAGATVSPFISSFELQAHYIAGQPESAVELMRFMWGDFMLDDPRMTNSTFIEGYSTDGSLHYAPYTNDPRVSHSHGWATGPTSALTFYAAGLQLTSAAGKTWKLAPSLGGLENVEAGYETTVGSFSSNVKAAGDGGLTIEFSAPTGTSGVISVEHPGKAGKLRIHDVDCKSGDIVVQFAAGETGRVETHNVSGGTYKITLSVN